MVHKAPGKDFRQGLSLAQVFKLFPDDPAAEAWFVDQRWPEGVACPRCGSVNVQTGAKHKTMPYRCREKECAKRFSARTGTVLEASNIGFQGWVIGIYLLSTNLKGVSSMKLHRDLSIGQKAAWHLSHRLREGFSGEPGTFAGPVEADEAYFGGKRKNMHKHQREALDGRGSVGKTAVVGVKDRETKQVRAKVVEKTDAKTLQGFVAENTDPEATVYTDDSTAYDSLPFEHETVKHSTGEYVKDQAHTNGIESFWSMLKRAHKGTFHKLSAKHLNRYVQEFAGRHNIRCLDTIHQMSLIARNLDQKRLRYRDLTA